MRDSLSSRGTRYRPPHPDVWRGHHGLILICAIHSHTSSSFRSILCSFLIQTSRSASAGLGSARLGSALVCQTLFTLPLGSEPTKTSKGASSLTAEPQEVPWKTGVGGFDFLFLVLIISYLWAKGGRRGGVGVSRQPHWDRRISKFKCNGCKCVIAL